MPTCNGATAVVWGLLLQQSETLLFGALLHKIWPTGPHEARVTQQ
jgi:hypothetical protein